MHLQARLFAFRIASNLSGSFIGTWLQEDQSMKKLLSVVAIASMVLLSFNAHSKLAANKLGLNKLATNGVSLNGLDQTLNLRDLAQVPLIKAN